MAVINRANRAAVRHALASEVIGDIEPGASFLLLSWGKFDFTDVILHCLRQAGEPVNLDIWTWVIAKKDVERLSAYNGISKARLFIDMDARERVRNNTGFAEQWRERFGQGSVRYVVSHAKMALIYSSVHNIFIRGSANANANPRCEQWDITEGGIDFDFMKQFCDEFPSLPDDASRRDISIASKTGNLMTSEEIPAFRGIKTWAR